MSVVVHNHTIDLQTVSDRVVAIVQFGPAGFATDGMKAGEYYQVTIDPRKISPSGEFIRFGDSPGDEITGWQRCRALSIVEILGDWPMEQVEPPKLQYGPQLAAQFLIPLQREA